MAFTVRVVNTGGDPVVDIRVVLSFKGPSRGLTAAEYTGADGRAEFDGHEEVDVIVFVDGRDCGTFPYREGGAVTVTERP